MGVSKEKNKKLVGLALQQVRTGASVRAVGEPAEWKARTIGKDVRDDEFILRALGRDGATLRISRARASQSPHHRQRVVLVEDYFAYLP